MPVAAASALTPSRNMLRFQSPAKAPKTAEEFVHEFGRAPLSPASESLLASPRRTRRRIPTVPYRVLDAPALQDDFYLHLVDWSAEDVLSVGLGSSVYLWNARTASVSRLTALATDTFVTSVSWSPHGGHLAVGCSTGAVELWDVERSVRVRTFEGHHSRVGSMSWAGNLLATGSRDRSIRVRDARMREQNGNLATLLGHRQEVCGLAWSPDRSRLASGGNDNRLLVWSAARVSSSLAASAAAHAAASSASSSSSSPPSASPISEPEHQFLLHKAAVKAIAWSPHQRGLLCSGGGTADRCIRFWNTLTGTALASVDTGSQVCNLAWSSTSDEIVSTHGYSLNQVIVWRYPTMTKLATLTGHTFRVLYLACSPDGETIVTGAGDETLRLWKVFPPKRDEPEPPVSARPPAATLSIASTLSLR